MQLAENGRLSRRAVATTLICLLVVVVDGFDLQSIGFVAPEIARTWSIPLGQFGFVFSAGLIGTIPGALLVGHAANRWGRSNVLQAALLVMAVGTFASAFAETPPILAACRLFGGLGMGAAYPLVMAIAADQAPPRYRATIMMIVITGQPIGSVAGAALCARLIPLYGWQAAFWLGGVASFLLIPPCLLVLRNRDGIGVSTVSAGFDDEDVGNILDARYRATTVHIWIGAILSTIQTFFLVNWLPGILRNEGFTLAESLLAISLVNAGGVVGGIGLGRLIDRRGPFRVVPTAYLVSAVVFGAFLFLRGQHLPTLVACLLVGLSSTGAGMCVGPLAVLLFPPRLRTISLGSALGLGRLSAAGMSLLIGLLLVLGLSNYDLFYVAVLVALLAMLNVLSLGRRQMHLARRQGGSGSE